MPLLRALTSFLAPPLCALCGDPCDYEKTLCGFCGRRIAGLTPARSLLGGELELVSAAPYEGVARELVQKLKFAARLTLAEVAAERMVRAWGGARAEWLVPVPPAPARQRARGFDVAYALARLVARGTAGSQVSVSLKRDDGPRQVGRSRASRTQNPPRVSLLDDKVFLPSDELWLVDDVATTGATLLACVEALYEAGATRIHALTFARAE